MCGFTREQKLDSNCQWTEEEHNKKWGGGCVWGMYDGGERHTAISKCMAGYKL